MNALASNRRRALALAAAIIAAGISLLAVTHVSAQGPTVSMGRVTLATEHTAKLDLNALDIGAPGLGSWQIFVYFDASVVDVSGCETSAGTSACNPDYSNGRMVVTGASATALMGDTTLASITFNCLRQGITGLTIGVSKLQDGTPGTPQPIAAAVQHGSVYCSARSYVLGDVDCDGDVDSVDAQLVLQYEADLISSLPCQLNGDVNVDGTINSIDAALILQYHAGLIDDLPPS